MKGLILAQKFYEACRPILFLEIPDIMERAAVGLVGEGSECFACDDAMSQDHDFGPAFCLWLPRAELSGSLERIEAALRLIPTQFGGFESRMAPQRRMGRVGPLPIEDFYSFFTGLTHPPNTLQEWLHIPEFQLAACTNGEVFADNAGIFTQWREVLAAHYPQDVRLKKLAARCMIMAQAGQYNLPRSLERGDTVGAMLAMGRFADAALSFVYLCNKRYMPFYKWSGRLAENLPVLGAQVTVMLRALAATPLGVAGAEANGLVEEFCSAVAAHLRKIGLSADSGDWLWAHGPQIMRHVEAAELRQMDMLQG